MARQDESIAYFIGVLHTDGCICTYRFRNKIRTRYILDVGKKSLPMLKRIRRIFQQRFGRIPKMRKKYHLNENPTFLIEVNIMNLQRMFNNLKIDKVKIAPWIRFNSRFFGAYLAGVIDGDGDVRIKRPAYPQCEMRITAGKKQSLLIELIRYHLKCSCRLEEAIISTYSLPRAKSKFGISYRHCFYLSSKNIAYFKKYVLPFITIKHKKEKLRRFIPISSSPQHAIPL